MEKSSAVTIVSEGKMFMDMMDNMRYYNAGREALQVVADPLKGLVQGALAPGKT